MANTTETSKPTKGFYQSVSSLGNICNLQSTTYTGWEIPTSTRTHPTTASEAQHLAHSSPSTSQGSSPEHARLDARPLASGLLLCKTTDAEGTRLHRHWIMQPGVIPPHFSDDLPSHPPGTTGTTFPISCFPTHRIRRELRSLQALDNHTMPWF